VKPVIINVSLAIALLSTVFHVVGIVRGKRANALSGILMTASMNIVRNAIKIVKHAKHQPITA
jgi:hypothetical protein